MTFPPVIRADWANHGCYGSLCATAGSCAAIFARRPELAGAAGQLAAFVFGTAKEGFDAYRNWRATGNWRYGPHGVEVNDWIATMLGGAAVAGPVQLSTGGF